MEPQVLVPAFNIDGDTQLNQWDDEDMVSGSSSKQSYNFQASNVNPKREKYLRYRTRLNAAEVDYAVTINLQLGSGSMNYKLITHNILSSYQPSPSLMIPQKIEPLPLLLTITESSLSCKHVSSLARDFLVSLKLGCKPWYITLIKDKEAN
ncbi:hypothetical protein Ahy_A10g047485 [Arachis hypogaea]|uniref:Uncharacterized protein n=1 Tax=Arachis hypogaea TaxID=3818 RepID=A0A445B2Q1_ARAHY|nr:hypothetical protein Ahy_A10g047485 [Arachis hypogaea]